MSGSVSRTTSKEVECASFSNKTHYSDTHHRTEKNNNNHNNDSDNEKDEQEDQVLSVKSAQHAVWSRLQQLQNLKSSGVVTAAEYEERRAQLVDQLTGTCMEPGESKKPARRHKATSQKAASVPRNPNTQTRFLGGEKVGESPKKLRSSKQKELSIPRGPPEWALLPSEDAILHTYNLDTNSWTSTNVKIQIEDTPFARGSLRYAYHVNGLAAFGDSHTCYVAKMSIDPYEARESYFEDVKMQMLCKEYAVKYNQYNPPKPIDFIKAWLLEFSERPDKPLAGVERFIHGAYRKHNNNFGFVSDEERNTPQAFSHFTYEASQHELLICDIQGVADCYTDPQIHNQDGRGFGKGNMGQRGFAKFLSTHRCNAICRYLKLPLVNAKVTDLGTVPAQQLMAYTKVQVTHIRYQSENTVVGLPKLKAKPATSPMEEEEASGTCCSCAVS